MSLGIAAFPRDSNPYQEWLYSPMRARGARVRYVGDLTFSHTLNVLLLPLELAWLSRRGYAIFHLHWTWGFWVAGSHRSSLVRRISRWWFGICLRLIPRLGMRLVWTAHNVVPHDPVFDDDLRARMDLVGSADLVIGLSGAALEDLRARFIEPRRSVVIPQGPSAPPAVLALEPPEPGAVRRIAFIGRVASYKGVTDLIAATRAVRGDLRLHIAGPCSDDSLRQQLIAAASEDERITLTLRFLPDEELAAVIGRADALVFPFRTATSSSSLALGLAGARVAVIPNLPGLRDVPDVGVIRYPPGVDGLSAALAGLLTLPGAELVSRGLEGRRIATARSWEEVADQTCEAMQSVIHDGLQRAGRVAAPTRQH